MKHFGFYKIATASLKLKIGNPVYNEAEIEKAAILAHANGAKVLVTPELSLCGYTCADLLVQEALRQSMEQSLRRLIQFSRELDLVLVIGMPLTCGYQLYNCAVVIRNGTVLGVVPKEYLPNYGEFNEKRWFASGAGKVPPTITLCNHQVPFGRILFELAPDLTMGVEICEDLWVTVPPSSLMALGGANLIVNLSAGNEVVAKAQYREALIVGQSARCICAYAYAGASVHESTTDAVFSGATMIAENGTVCSKGELFCRESTICYGVIDVQQLNHDRQINTTFGDNAQQYMGAYQHVRRHFDTMGVAHFDRFVEAQPFVPSTETVRHERCTEIFEIQAAGLAKRLEYTGARHCILGISGGLDSTLALLVCVHTMKLLGYNNQHIIGVTLPGFGTTDRTYQNALDLMKALGITMKEISIKDACLQHMQDIDHDSTVHDVTYENAQARERTQILMDLANKHGALLVGTGDLSEIAMGWCTYNGDHMSMYGVNAGVPKTLVRYLVDFVAETSDPVIATILHDVVVTPISPELLPPNDDGSMVQTTESSIGPYELHDFFLYHFVRFGSSKEKIAFLASCAFKNQYTPGEIDKWLTSFLNRFFASQFKRSCMPDGPQVGTISLSPRTDWRMPSDADGTIWNL